MITWQPTPTPEQDRKAEKTQIIAEFDWSDFDQVALPDPRQETLQA